jgi:hypothetical protein
MDAACDAWWGGRDEVDDEVMNPLGEAFLAAWERRCEPDAFAALAATARLHARQPNLSGWPFAYLRQAD